MEFRKLPHLRTSERSCSANLRPQTKYTCLAVRVRLHATLPSFFITPKKKGKEKKLPSTPPPKKRRKKTEPELRARVLHCRRKGSLALCNTAAREKGRGLSAETIEENPQAQSHNQSPVLKWGNKSPKK